MHEASSRACHEDARHRTIINRRTR